MPRDTRNTSQEPDRPDPKITAGAIQGADEADIRNRQVLVAYFSILQEWSGKERRDDAHTVEGGRHTKALLGSVKNAYLRKSFSE
jgi:hypothetical protein